MNRLLRALMLLVVLGSLVVAGLSYALLAELRRPVDPQATEPIDFEIQSGQTGNDIATSLKELNLIRQPTLFKLMLRERNANDKLKVGTYQLSPSMTMGQIISTLQVPPSFEEKQLQTIEGMRMEEVAQAVVSAGFAPNTDAFLAVAKDAAPFKEKHTRLKDIPDKQGLEGYLFPSTYRIKATATITDVIEKMLTDGFDANYAEFEKQITVEGNRSVHDIVTMASIIQREAANENEMAHLSYIFWNRIKPENAAETGGMLGADPTVQYMMGYSQEEKTWWRKNIDTGLKKDDPYNTRVNKGLPPGPIANPGAAALRAAARPGSQRPDGSDGSKDLYFVAKCGEKAHTFAATYAEFQKVQNEYLNCKQ